MATEAQRHGGLRARGLRARSHAAASRLPPRLAQAALALVLLSTSVSAAELPHTELAATLSLSPPHIRGRVATTVTNTSATPIDEVVVLLFPNRFAEPDAAVDDVTRPYVYPGEDFVPGWIEVGEVRAGGVAMVPRELGGAGMPASWGLRLPLPVPLRPGEATTVSLEFATRLPERFGSFGEYGDTLTAVGGWYPSVAALDADGSWIVDGLPPLTDFEVELAAEVGLDVLLNGRFLRAGEAPVRISVDAVHYLSLVAATELLREQIDTGEARIDYYPRPPPTLNDRINAGPTQVEITRDALRDIVRHRPPAVPGPSDPLVIVEAPLRLDLTAPGEGMVVISDRSLELSVLLRPFHQAQLAQAIYAELGRPPVAARESVRDYAWVSEGLSYERARSYRAARHAGTRSVQSWIELFNLFAIVDRFEVAPKIPYVNSFFERQPLLDPLHQQISTFNNDRPAGHVVLGKLRQLVGDAAFERVVAFCAEAATTFRRCAADAAGRDLDWFFAQWVQPYPQMNYAVEDVEIGEEVAVTVRRESTRPVLEPVAVRLQSIGGEILDLRWDGRGDSGRLTAAPAFPVHRVIVDPERRLIETTRVDNASPPELQVILDTAAVEVSSTEFGVSGLVVARRRYDYRRDLAAAGFLTNRGIGVTAGGRYHWGEQIDPASYRHNLYGFYVAAALDRSFRDDRRPDVLTAGHINGLGLRYDYNNIFWYDNPTHEVQLQLFVDWYDRALGSDYDYVDWGGGLVLTHPLWSYRSIVAGQIFNGFSEPLGSSRVPNQGLYSLGGSRSIRGIGAEEELGRNIFLLRGELRQTLPLELDLNLLDLLVLRRVQLRGFVDTGQVSNSAGRVYDPEGYAVGVGVGFGAFYDFLGFFPSLAYVEVATRADRSNDLQFLFGTRQAF